VSLRAAYRLEYGWLSGHYVDLGLNAQLSRALAVTVSQELGVLMDKTTVQTLPAFGTDVQASWRAGRWLVTGLRCDARYGDAGRTLGVQAWMGVDQSI